MIDRILKAIGAGALESFITWIRGIFRRRELKRRSDQKAADSVQPLKDAKTAEEVDQATDKVLDDL